MFTAEERKEYGFGTFEEDLKATNDECYGKGDMAWEDLEKRAGRSLKSIRHGLRRPCPVTLADVCCCSPLAVPTRHPACYTHAIPMWPTGS